MEVAKAGRKKKTKKARGIQDESPTKQTTGINKKKKYTGHKGKLKGLYNRLVRDGQI